MEQNYRSDHPVWAICRYLRERSADNCLGDLPKEERAFRRFGRGRAAVFATDASSGTYVALRKDAGAPAVLDG